MDKIKQNLFWIATGGIVVVLLVLGYLLVWDKAQALGGKTAEIDAKNTELDRPLKQSPPPSAKYLQHLKDTVKASSEEVNAAIAYYDNQGKVFDRFFDDQEVAPDVSSFAARYTDGINGLVNAYRTKHGIQEDPNAREAPFPRVSRMDEQLGEANLGRAMREYWVIEQVFKAINDFGIGGLQTLDFPGREQAGADEASHVETVKAHMAVALRFSVLEDFLTTLLGNPRVPLIVASLTFAKDPQGLAGFTAMTKVKEYKDAGEANKETYAALEPEPTVLAEIDLEAIDWKTMEPVPSDIPESTEDSASGAPGKSPRSPRKPRG